MQFLLLKLRKSREDIDATVYIDRPGQEPQCLGTLYGLTLKDVEWLVTANSSEQTTPFIVEVAE